MPNGGVSKKTFENADTDSKLNILYDQNQELIKTIEDLKNKDNNINTHCIEQWATCDNRFKKIERHWYKITGALVIIAAISPFISTLIIKYWI
jgi:hypothetical protein